MYAFVFDQMVRNKGLNRSNEIETFCEKEFNCIYPNSQLLPYTINKRL